MKKERNWTRNKQAKKMAELKIKEAIPEEKTKEIKNIYGTKIRIKKEARKKGNVKWRKQGREKVKDKIEKKNVRQNKQNRKVRKKIRIKLKKKTKAIEQVSWHLIRCIYIRPSDLETKWGSNSLNQENGLRDQFAKFCAP